MEILEDSPFEEKPVDLKTFVEGRDYLGLPPLSEEQYKLVAASTQIYKKETLIELYGEREGTRIYKQTMSEVIAQLGKGSGKDYTATISVARIVYLLLCLKEPAEYYGKPAGDAIDILNIAINAQQANNVFFKGFKKRIENSPWFEGKFYIKMGSVEFDKNITCHSGHSERESWEGYNVLVVILDEISGFAIETTSGSEQAKTAQAIYKMYRGSVMSRFPEVGKTILLSFPRYKGDFIQQRYDAAVGEKITTVQHHKFKIDPELPDGTEGNEFDIEWDEDKIISYKEPRVYAIKLPTWKVNPLMQLESLMTEFFADPVDALSRFACMPPEAVDAYFKDRGKVESAFSLPDRAFDDNWRFLEAFQPDPQKEYFVHVDLAYKHDHCAVALAHVDSWQVIKIADNYSEPGPFVIVDAIRYWTPTSTSNVNFDEVRNYIVSLRSRGFNIKLVTFDRWQSIDTMNYLEKVGMATDRLSVAKKHYDDLSLLVQEERVKGPRVQLLIDEMLQLRIMKGEKVDHPRKASKDLADAVVGAVYNAVAHTQMDVNRVIEVKFLEPSMLKDRNKIEAERAAAAQKIINPPRATQPPPYELASFLDRMKVLE